MIARVLSVAHFGLKAIPIEVEVNLASRGFPGFNIIGLPAKSIEESRERVKTSLVNSGFNFPMAKITVNLAPADIPKEGSFYDLPIAVGILHCNGELKLPDGGTFFYGELSLDGSLRHTKGVFLAVLAAKEMGVRSLFVPLESAQEGAVVEGVSVFGVKNLRQLVTFLNTGKGIEKIRHLDFRKMKANRENVDFDFGEIIGQEFSKRALEIAAAGGHNVFMQGPPGAGKTMLARALPSILPPLTLEEALEVTRVYSVAGGIPPGGSLIVNRPFRAPHHTTSRVGLIGGGSNPHPGEISLAHNGVLFLDELPEFSRSTLEALRQPLEDGRVSITRAAGTVLYPAAFMLVAAANPCPCGFLGDSSKACVCSPRVIMRYSSKLSGPLMDRIDMHIQVSAVDVEKLIPSGAARRGPQASREIRDRVVAARKIQNGRFRGTGIHANAFMRNRHIGKFCSLNSEANNLLKQAVNTYGLSARTYFRLIKVSRTIADLTGSQEILAAHVAEALQYRVRVQD